jgi:uncharacterized protein with gpF-like domain
MEKKKTKVKQFHLSSRRRLNLRKEFQEQTRLRNNYERKFRKQLRDFFAKLYDEYSKEYENLGDTSVVFQRLQPELFQIFDNHYRTVIEVFGLRMLRELRKQEEQFEIIYRDYARVNLGTKIVGIAEVTRRHIQKIVLKNLDENLGVVAIAKDIKKAGRSSFTRYRSSMIARTETHSAASFANHRVAQSMNLPNQRKRWIATLDARTRNAHMNINGTEIGIDDDFNVNGAPMSYPGDPRGGAGNVINCRCVLLYINDLDEIE